MFRKCFLVASVFACSLLAPGSIALGQSESVTFTRRPAVVGDSAEQSVAVDLRLKTTARSGAKVLEQGESTMQRRQSRVMTTTKVSALGTQAAGTQAATVAYRSSERSVGGEKLVDPIAGKAYHCTRQGETLAVTTLDGDIPPLDEFQLVAKNIETLGLENPLAKYLSGRTVRIGEEIDLPIEVAAELLGLEEDFGEAKRFSLKLVGSKVIEGHSCAVFKTEIEAGSTGRSQMGLVVAGEFVVRTDSCRTVSADLSGPIGMSETRAIPAGPIQITGMGNFKVAIRTKFVDRR